jgi:hypothetical protein
MDEAKLLPPFKKKHTERGLKLLFLALRDKKMENRS